jgi:hypothetical protein
MNKAIGFTMVATLIIATIASATIINVPDQYSTIQLGLNAASPGDTVLVAPGTYYENIIWPDVDGVKLFGSGMVSTVIDGNSQASVIRFDTAYIISRATVVRGFTLTNGFAQPPWPQSQGGGICIFYASPTLEYLDITGNMADDFGGGIYIWGSASAPLIRYVVISNNAAISHGGVDCVAGSPVFDHVTVTQNNPGGMYFDTSGDPLLENCISAYNTYFGIRVEGDSFQSTSISIGYSDTDDLVQLIGVASINWLAGNIDADPRFIDVAAHDFHLLSDSPCIDAGDPAYPLDPDGTVTDMGAFYFDQSAVSVPSAIGDLVISTLGNDVQLVWSPVTTDTAGNTIMITEYIVYSSQNPFFIPAPGDSIGVIFPPDSVFLHGDALSQNPRFYNVKAVIEP